MNNKIVGMDGSPVPDSSVPDPEVVEVLESLLAKAKSGGTHAVACVYETQDGVQIQLAGSGPGFEMLGGLDMVKSEIRRYMRGEAHDK